MCPPETWLPPVDGPKAALSNGGVTFMLHILPPGVNLFSRADTRTGSSRYSVIFLNRFSAFSSIVPAQSHAMSAFRHRRTLRYRLYHYTSTPPRLSRPCSPAFCKTSSQDLRGGAGGGGGGTRWEPARFVTPLAAPSETHEKKPVTHDGAGGQGSRRLPRAGERGPGPAEAGTGGPSQAARGAGAGCGRSSAAARAELDIVDEMRKIQGLSPRVVRQRRCEW